MSSRQSLSRVRFLTSVLTILLLALSMVFGADHSWAQDPTPTPVPTALPPTISDTQFPLGTSNRSGMVGEERYITGSGFLTATAVDFNGTAAIWTPVDDNTILAFIPEGATTGPIHVVAPSGTASSPFFFTITPPPAPTATPAPVVKGTLQIPTTTGGVEASTTTISATLRCATRKEGEPAEDVAVNPTAPVRVVVDVTTASTTGSPFMSSTTTLQFPAGSCPSFLSIPMNTGNDIVQGTQTFTIVVTTASADPNYDGIVSNPTTFIRADLHDVYATSIADPRTSETDTRTGRTTNFTIGLNHDGRPGITAGDLQPRSNVFVTVSVTDAAGAPPGGADEAKLYTDTQRISNTSQTLVFTPNNYRTPQNIYVQGLDDTDMDGDQLYTVAVTDVVSADPEYNKLYAPDTSPNPGNYILNVDDEAQGNVADDLPGVIITPASSPSSPLTTNESGSTSAFRVRLNSEPTANVVVRLRSSRVDEGRVSPAFLTFTPSNWSQAQQVTVTGVDDDVEDNDQPYRIITTVESSDTNYGGNPSLNPATPPIDPIDVFVVNQDNEKVGFTVNPGVLLLTEGGATSTFTVRLNRQPASDVVINVRSGNESIVTVSPSRLTFTNSNWSTPQSVTVRAIDNFIRNVDQNFTILLEPAISADPLYNGQDPADVTGNVLDNEVAAITVTPTSGLTTTEAGGSATFTVRLTSQPTATVTIDLSSSDTTEGTVSPSSLTFNSSNWSTPQTVTVTGVDDLQDDGDEAYTIVTEVATSTDTFYGSLNAADVSVTNTDNDTLGVTVTPLALTTTEGGAPATFTVVLDAQPTSNVTISINTDLPPFPTTEGTVNKSSLVFTPANFNVPQTVTVIPGDDDVVDGSKSYRIITGVASSSDARYNGINPPDVTVTNQDNDVAGATVSTTSLTTVERGTPATFTVRLLSQPTANVTVRYTSLDTTEGLMAGPSQTPAATTQVNFTPNNWSTPQTVRVVPVDDNVFDRAITYFVSSEILPGNDPNYNNRPAPYIRVVNGDNDTPGWSVSPSTGLRTSEAGGTASFTVRLTSEPTANVTVSVSSSDATEGAVNKSTLIFTPNTGQAVSGTTSGWNVPQTVTVRGINDNMEDGNIAYSIVLRPSSSDSIYSGVGPVRVTTVSAINLDDGDDQTAPTITIVNPADGGPYRTLSYVTGNASDNKGIARVTVRIYRYTSKTDAAGYVAADGSVTPTYNAGTHELLATGTTSWSLRLPSLGTGRYQIRATVTDKVGLQRNATRGFYIDQLGPRITLTQPTSATTTSVSQAIGNIQELGGSRIETADLVLYRYGNATTPAGHLDGSVFVAGYTRNALTLDGVGNFSFSLPDLVPSRYLLRIRATDNLGNNSQLTTVFEVKPPALTPTPIPTVTVAPTPDPTNAPEPTPAPTSAPGTAFDNSRSNYLISIPYMDTTSRTSTTTVDKAFTVPPVSHDGTVNFRLRQFDPIQQAYIQLNSSSILVRGRGYFLEPVAGGTALKTPAMDPTRMPMTDGVFDITLLREESNPLSDPNNGFNLIGFPFDPARFSFADWSTATVIYNGQTYSSPAAAAAATDSVMFAELFEYDESRGGYIAATRLEPFKGYAVRTKKNGVIVRLTASR